MTTGIRLALICLLCVLLLGLGAWYYLFGPNQVDAAELVPSDAVAFITIPNAARLTADYETSRLRKLVDAPDAQPLIDQVVSLVGSKNFDLAKAFLPNLSGQSFLAVTHWDLRDPAASSVIYGLKPKAGLGDFDAFVDKLKAAYPDLAAHSTTSAGQVDGLDYQSIQSTGLPKNLYIARTHGWIVMASDQAALQDWWERFQKKPASPSLAQNHDYLQSLARIGKNPEAITYVDQGAIVASMEKQLERTSTVPPVMTTAGNSGILAFGTGFEQGDIVDHFSVLVSSDAQSGLGMKPMPCAFDTLKFTSPDTLFYWGASFDWDRIWKNLQTEAIASTPPHPEVGAIVSGLQNWAQSHQLDVERNIIAPLGGEISIQSEWSDDANFPEAGLFLKLDKPDDFAPTIAAILDTVRADYADRAVVNEIDVNGHKFATLKFVTPAPIGPTMTEDGPYFGIFLTENQAVRSFQRDASVGLLNNANFQRQIGDRRQGANQIMFLDSPRLLDRAYQTALPLLSLGAMLNPKLAALTQNQKLPPNLQWLAPIDTWSFVSSSDHDGVTGYSISGVGNQGLALAAIVPALSFLPSSLGPLSGMFSNFLPSTPAPAPAATGAGPTPGTSLPDNSVPPTPSAAPNLAPMPTTIPNSTPAPGPAAPTSNVPSPATAPTP